MLSRRTTIVIVVPYEVRYNCVGYKSHHIRSPKACCDLSFVEKSIIWSCLPFNFYSSSFFFFLLPVIWCFVLVHLIDGKLMCLFMYSRYSNKIRFIVNVSLNYYLYTPSNIIACCTAICIFCCIIMIIVVHCSFMCDLMLFVLVSRLF